MPADDALVTMLLQQYDSSARSLVVLGAVSRLLLTALILAALFLRPQGTAASAILTMLALLISGIWCVEGMRGRKRMAAIEAVLEETGSAPGEKRVVDASIRHHYLYLRRQYGQILELAVLAEPLLWLILCALTTIGWHTRFATGL